MTVPDQPQRMSTSPELLPGILALSEDDFRTIRTLVYERLGINLTDQKRALVVGRLQKQIRQHGLTSFSQYCELLKSDTSGQALAELADRISTGHSFFYREKAHFDLLTSRVLPEMTAGKRVRGRRDLRVWSAGCAAGEEPYTLAMVMMDYFKEEYVLWDAGALATDISAEALAEARNGIYSQDRLKHVPLRLKLAYFEKTGHDLWRIAQQVKTEVTFRRFNLMNKSFPFKQPFDIIFCRNVMIYFDAVTRRDLVQRLFDSTAPGGYLFIGHSESLPRDSCPYRAAGAAVYRREDR